MNKTIFLGDISFFVDEKVKTALLNVSNYIGVDNLLPNRAGITTSKYLPKDASAIKFKKGDILIGNIRPYLKKIWLATFDGGCSPDVLCLRPKNSKLSKFIYMSLSQDSFFDYVMKGSKGTRMPRGDKKHILLFKLSDIPSKENLSDYFYYLCEKIELNNKINDNLSKSDLTI